MYKIHLLALSRDCILLAHLSEWEIALVFSLPPPVSVFLALIIFINLLNTNIELLICYLM